MNVAPHPLFKVHSLFKVLLLCMGFLLSLGLSILLNHETIAQVNPQIVPSIEVIDGGDNIPPSYRLVINRSEDIVFVSCPENYEPRLNYLSNELAIQCQLFQPSR